MIQIWFRIMSKKDAAWWAREKKQLNLDADVCVHCFEHDAYMQYSCDSQCC